MHTDFPEWDEVKEVGRTQAFIWYGSLQVLMTHLLSRACFLHATPKPGQIASRIISLHAAYTRTELGWGCKVSQPCESGPLTLLHPSLLLLQHTPRESPTRRVQHSLWRKNAFRRTVCLPLRLNMLLSIVLDTYVSVKGRIGNAETMWSQAAETHQRYRDRVSGTAKRRGATVAGVLFSP